MFALRGIAISFSVFFIVYSSLSLSVCLMWQKLRTSASRQTSSSGSFADWLFAFRIAPFFGATFITLALTLPSFLLLEPHSVDEPLGYAPLTMSLAGMLLLLIGICGAAAAWMRTSKTIAAWAGHARAMERQPDSKPSVPVLLTSASAPPLTAAGILRPQVWLSSAAQFVLTERELHCALLHEKAHIRRRDNLKKLILRLLAFPGMAPMESAWREACEISADDAAVSCASEALDLAAALIKLSRLAPLQPPAELSTAFLHSPAASVNARVERLIAWQPPPRPQTNRKSLAYTLCALAAVLATVAITYSQLLIRVHAATEWLVR